MILTLYFPSYFLPEKKVSFCKEYEKLLIINKRKLFSNLR